MKKCFKCSQTLSLNNFYKHSGMGDGHLNKCKECTKKDNKTSNGNYSRTCIVCGGKFRTTREEIKRGGGKCCSRKCYYLRLKIIVKRGKNSPYWKGEKVGLKGLHTWLNRQKGSPKKCEECLTTTAKLYDWANISKKYKRELSDYKRLCRVCHIKFDQKERVEKWRKTVSERYGWDVKK